MKPTTGAFHATDVSGLTADILDHSGCLMFDDHSRSVAKLETGAPTAPLSQAKLINNNSGQMQLAGRTPRLLCVACGAPTGCVYYPIARIVTQNLLIPTVVSCQLCRRLWTPLTTPLIREMNNVSSIVTKPPFVGPMKDMSWALC